MLEAISWTGEGVRLLDQTKLPEVEYVEISDERQMHDAIRRLVVRGAPAIGVAAAFGVFLGVRRFDGTDPQMFMQRLAEVCAYLATSRPTAVNLFWAIDRIGAVAREIHGDHVSGASPPCHMVREIQGAILDECLLMLEEDTKACRAIGENTLRLFEQPLDRPINLLTHCNAGALATVRYGTALAGVYVGAERGRRFHVYADETRPLLQGSRITATELNEAGVDVTVICDSTAATVLQQGKVDAVIVGADRIAANGDTANKIGTLPLAIVARHFGVPFYVAAPISTIDLSAGSGADIPIEQRGREEVTRLGGQSIAPEGVDVFNPAFDVTPAELITAIITDRGIARFPYGQTLADLARRD
jgi:methylthioribose-1-phosphate isomerase